MAISSVTSGSNLLLAALQKQSSTTAVQAPPPPPTNDGDSDDAVAAVKASAPSVNLNGQTVGSTINGYGLSNPQRRPFHAD